jgi:Na+-translocating ferredoxin:NAD+ oxidoreductase subunit E
MPRITTRFSAALPSMTKTNSPSIHTQADGVPFLIALCPLLAASETLLRALALGVAFLVVVLIAAAGTSALRRWISAEQWLSALALLVATAAAAVELATRAWFHGAFQSLEMFMALLVANCATYYYFATHITADGFDPLLKGARLGLTIVIAMLILGGAREIVGYGALLHDAREIFGPQWTFGYVSFFKADMGFLLAVLPPGAFIAAGILFALVNAWRARHE